MILQVSFQQCMRIYIPNNLIDILSVKHYIFNGRTKVHGYLSGNLSKVGNLHLLYIYIYIYKQEISEVNEQESIITSGKMEKKNVNRNGNVWTISSKLLP